AQAEALALRARRDFRQITPAADEAATTAALLQHRLIDDVLKEQNLLFLAEEDAHHADKKETLLSVLRRQLESQRDKALERIRAYEQAGGSKQRLVPAEQGKLAKFMARMESKIASVEHGSSFSFEDPITVGVLVAELEP